MVIEWWSTAQLHEHNGSQRVGYQSAYGTLHGNHGLPGQWLLGGWVHDPINTGMESGHRKARI